jgi:hypothetical protein
MYFEIPESLDLRSEKKNGNKIKVWHNFLVGIKSRMCYYVVHALYMF